jgi:hypothetical protein
LKHARTVLNGLWIVSHTSEREREREREGERWERERGERGRDRGERERERERERGALRLARKMCLLKVIQVQMSFVQNTLCFFIYNNTYKASNDLYLLELKEV